MTKFIWKQSAVSILHDVYWYIIKCNAAFVCIRVQRKSVLQLPFQASFSLVYTSPGVILTCPKAFWRAGLIIINQNLSVISIPVLLIHSNNNFECEISTEISVLISHCLISLKNSLKLWKFVLQYSTHALL